MGVFATATIASNGRGANSIPGATTWRSVSAITFGFLPVGPEKEEIGSPTQMAVFQR
ncbi:MAG TPA: hypothetical protein PKH24_14250 [Sedimentisphaerales bacterium]|jgi:hypothetical protein|nr:hypothetical protein [Sedimentisphaerales bacterium]HNU30467.1 hypothetical protein [Sedimentisphaerales bacterium]